MEQTTTLAGLGNFLGLRKNISPASATFSKFWQREERFENSIQSFPNDS
jgi:hypothetical protein